MTEHIHERVDVITIYRKASVPQVMPYKIKWNGRIYLIKHLGYHHKVKEGKTIIHIFSCSSETLGFRLRFNSDTLSWILEEVEDGTSHQS